MSKTPKLFNSDMFSVTYGHLKVVDILIALLEQQTPFLDFWILDLHLYTKCQQMKKKNYSKLYYNSLLVLKFAFDVCIVPTLNT